LSGILDRIDATLDGLCPCGAPPREGSAYCGEDCVPNWRGLDTSSHYDGTAMRWTPNPPAHFPTTVRIDPEPVMRMARDMSRIFAAMAESLRPLADKLSSLALVANAPAAEAEHPLARMNARRANLSYGPRRPRRPPRSLDLRH